MTRTRTQFAHRNHGVNTTQYACMEQKWTMDKQKHRAASAVASKAKTAAEAAAVAKMTDWLCHSHQHHHHPNISDSSILWVKCEYCLPSTITYTPHRTAWTILECPCMCLCAYILVCICIFHLCARVPSTLHLSNQHIKRCWFGEPKTINNMREPWLVGLFCILHDVVFVCDGVTLSFYNSLLFSRCCMLFSFAHALFFSLSLSLFVSLILILVIGSDEHTVETGLWIVSKCSFTTPRREKADKKTFAPRSILIIIFWFLDFWVAQWFLRTVSWFAWSTN